MPRGRQRRPAADREPEHEDLFALLWEQAVPSTPIHWFEMPWRNPANAIRLAVALAAHTSRWTNDQSELVQFLLKSHTDDSAAYEQASLMRSLARSDEDALLTSAIALERALEMFLRWKANSDGGGLLYNDHLLAICEQLLNHGAALEVVEPIVRKWRQRDAIGIGVNDAEPEDAVTQRRLRAFETAWKAGLFKVAFCV